MERLFDTIIIGQGLAGTALAWTLIERNRSVLVVEGDDGISSSRVAAGLMTPVTGKRMVSSPDFEADWCSAIDFYKRQEGKLEQRFLSLQPVIRIFESSAQRSEWLDRSDKSEFLTVESWEGPLEQHGPRKIGVLIGPAGRIHLPTYLDASRQAFQNMAAFQVASIDVSTDLIEENGGLTIQSLKAWGRQVVLCTGAKPTDAFPNVPNNPAKGEMLKVDLSQSLVDRVVHRSLWLAPEIDQWDGEKAAVSDTRYTVGATYNWRDTSENTSAEGRAELIGKLGRLLVQKPAITDHIVGVRPTMKDRQPVMGAHPDRTGLWIFNGLGSKGTLKAPRLAQQLADTLIEGVALPKQTLYSRLFKDAERSSASLTSVAQDLISEVLSKGDLVVDGTVGRGFDTVFLSQKVANSGEVIGFDVQLEALDSTRKRLNSIEATNVTLHHLGHERAAETLGDRRIQAAMLNLGFLPRSDKSVTTSSKTTETALEAIYRQLQPGGRMTVLSYRGHEGGPEEYRAVEEWTQQLLSATVKRYESPVAKPTAPVLFSVTKDS